MPLSGLAVEIAASAQSGKSRFEIRLDPADLGRIDVRIDVDRNGQVTSHLTVEKPETLSMLRQDAPQLQRALDNAGFKTGDGGLQFSLRDQSSSGPEQRQRDRPQRAAADHQRRRHRPRGGRRTKLWPHARIEQRRRHQGLRRRDMTTAMQPCRTPVVSGTTPLPTSSSSSSSAAASTRGDATIAGNFQTFLTLLTTQLQNQNPLDPLDTNQFTQQLVQFAGVEQQLKTNDQLTHAGHRCSRPRKSTQALGFVGKTAVVDGSTAP